MAILPKTIYVCKLYAFAMYQQFGLGGYDKLDCNFALYFEWSVYFLVYLQHGSRDLKVSNHVSRKTSSWRLSSSCAGPSGQLEMMPSLEVCHPASFGTWKSSDFSSSNSFRERRKNTSHILSYGQSKIFNQPYFLCFVFCFLNSPPFF